MRERNVGLTLLAIALSACGDSGPAEPGAELGEHAQLYLAEALDVMEYNSVRRNEIDWADFRGALLAEATALGASEPADVHPLIVEALERLGDGHSFFRSAGADGEPLATLPGDPSEGSGDEPRARLVAPGVGYVGVAAFSGGGEWAADFASLYHALLREVESSGPVCRWVVDLRGNTGGNMWPMVAAVGPILGEGTVGHFVDADSVATSWFYAEGRAGIDDVALVEVAAPYELEGGAPHVAVLTDRRTASSGEAVAVAFRGRDGARSFGEPTWGVSTANAGFPLSDGSVVFLTVATMADRDGTVYGTEIEPDAVISGGTKTGEARTDLVLRAAVRWLSGRACI